MVTPPSRHLHAREEAAPRYEKGPSPGASAELAVERPMNWLTARRRRVHQSNRVNSPPPKRREAPEFLDPGSLIV